MLDLTANGPAQFPFSVWSKLQRQVMADYSRQLLQSVPHQGYSQLRQAIARHLWDFRGMAVQPENIVIGAGTDFLYNLLIQLLGRQRTYAVEDPGYDKIRRIYALGGVRCISAEMDAQGVTPKGLAQAQVLHISPAHHFPTGIITPMSRRAELLRWAEQVDGYIIEDDYDSEFRFRARPMAALQTMDRQGRVIYMNSFSKSLAPSIRIGYMVLPQGLMARFRAELGFYSCTVSSFEQYTLARFLSRGHFEQHINRIRKFYKARRDRVLETLAKAPFARRLTVLEEDAGLHFLLQVDTPMTDEALTAYCEARGIRVRSLSSYYHLPIPESDQRCLVINYAGVNQEDLDRVLAAWDQD
jgi:GntR family transcriptional regulator/MocR family aminotransferase